MQVYAATDESDVGMIRAGQRVSFKVDAFPNDTFYGEVLQIRMNPTTVQNVVTYNTIVNFDNPELKLFPGMTAYITIPVAQAKDTLKIPNGALRYKPDMKPEDVKALYAKSGIDPNMPGSVDRQPGMGGGQGGQRGAGGGQAGATDAGMGRGGQRGGQGAPAGAAAAGQGGQPGGAMPQMRERRQDIAVVWKLMPDKSIQPVQVRTGITDHTVTALVEVLHGDLKEGDQLVTGSAKASAGGNRAPGAPGAMRR
jgi:HlyD family secretion protein